MPRAARRGGRRVRIRKKADLAVAGQEDSDGAEVESLSAEEEEEQRRIWIHNLWHFLVLVVLLVVYGFSISVIDSNRELLSACWREILGELYPDEAKDAERITEGEVVPKWAEFLHADDVTKQINWFQTFCKFKHGMDDHLEFKWRCNIIKVELDWPVDTRPLAPFMNCSRDFITNHIIKGDDPRCVPWARDDSLELLQKLESSQRGYASKVGSVDEIYDEYTVREGNPMWETVDAGFEKIDNKLESIQAGIEKFVADDAASSHPRRLPEAGLQTDLCPDMHCPWRGVNDDREPEDVPCNCFDWGLLANGQANWKSKRTCRNHHWGLMHLCKPSHIAVKFYIERVDIHTESTKEGKKQELRARVLWFMVEMIFEDLQPVEPEDTPSGWYKTYLNLKQGEFYGYKSTSEGIVAALTIMMLFFVLIREAFWTTMRLPHNLKQLLALREPSIVEARLKAEEGDDAEPSLESVRWLFEQSSLQLADGRGVRRKYMDPMSMVLENFAIVCTIFGFFLSFSDWNKNFIPREYDTSERISPASYIMGELHGSKQLTEFVFEVFFDDTPWHGLAWILLYFRTLFYFLQSFPGLRWIPVSMTLASVRVMYFFLAYGFLILGFGILAYIQFGQRFVQFSSLKRACYELLFLSCGFPGYVFEDIFPYEDSGSWLASSFLAVYVVVAVTLGLNFFTTIILDAYNLAINPDGAQQVLEESWVSISDMLMSALGIDLDLYDDGEDSHGTGVGHDDSSAKHRQSHSSKRVSEVELALSNLRETGSSGREIA